jgi:hypothetical protein
MSKMSLALLFLSCCGLLVALVQGQSADCPLSSDIDLVGDGSFLLRQVINPSTSTVSVELEYLGIGWVGIAFSETSLMVPNTAIIGLPDDGTVQKYDLTIRDISGVLPASSDRQTLTGTSIVQDGTSTILSFTRDLVETSETTVVAGSNMINVAYGSSNTLAYHLFRLPTTATFSECVLAAPVKAPVAAPRAVPIAFPVEEPMEKPVGHPKYGFGKGMAGMKGSGREKDKYGMQKKKMGRRNRQ